MKVKISVKKLHRMEQMYLQWIKDNKRLYLGEVDGWKKENEYLKEKIAKLSEKAEALNALNEEHRCLKNRYRSLDDKCESLKLEVQDRKSAAPTFRGG